MTRTHGWGLNVQWKVLSFIVLPSLLADLVWFYYYRRPAVIGLLGDLYNFAGALWLAFDLLFKERESKRKEILNDIQTETRGRQIPFEVDGIEVKGDDDIERVFRWRAAKQASSASVLLLFGLILVLGARLLEFVEQGHIEVMWQMLRR